MSEYIVMYDVRGIQNYVFKTNELKDVIGASKIIDELIINKFKSCTNDILKDNCRFDWDQYDKLSFFDAQEVKCEVIYYGGGNLVVLFRCDEETLDSINFKIALEIVKESYGLSLACAKVPVSSKDNYLEDYQELRDKMDEVKDNMPEIKLQGALPIVQTDPVTGYPLSEFEEGKMVSRESKLKKEAAKSDKKNDEAKVLNDFGAKEGESQMAIVHIDGNSMGQMITDYIKDAPTYEIAAKKMREISSTIHQVFETNALKAIKNKLPEINVASGLKEDRKAFRTIIKAGDDITFVCNARIALRCVETFIDSITKENVNFSKGKLSACAGIAIMNTHFPFSVGYQIAEELCDSAKKKAKSHKQGDHVGNYVDFHICYSGLLYGLDQIRIDNYYSKDNKSLLIRPYSLDKGGLDYIQEFKDRLDTFHKVPRSKAKELRDAYYGSASDINFAALKITSRDPKALGETSEGSYYNKYDYDALEMLDLHWQDVKQKQNQGGEDDAD